MTIIVTIIKRLYPSGAQTLHASGGASAVKEPGHFEVRKSSSHVTRMHFFLKKSWRPFLAVALKTQDSNAVSPSKYNK